MTGPAASQPPRLTLVLGGVRSGKSAFAEGLAAGLNRPVLYLATGQAADPDMTERIRRHRERRPAHWQTLEEPLTPALALSRARLPDNPPGVLLLDSVDFWLANLLLSCEGEEPAAVEALALGQVADLLAAIAPGWAAVLVSSEAGLSPVPTNRLGRQFQDLLGAANQRIAAAADRVYLVVAGYPLPVKPGCEPA